MSIAVKRAYEPPAPQDGTRVLVDRYWPRGLRKEQAALDAWLKEVAPSRELIAWFGHQPERWDEFQRRYREELSRPELQNILSSLRDKARQGTLTLLYSARDEQHNNAVALAAYLAEAER